MSEFQKGSWFEKGWGPQSYIVIRTVKFKLLGYFSPENYFKFSFLKPSASEFSVGHTAEQQNNTLCVTDKEEH